MDLFAAITMLRQQNVFQVRFGGRYRATRSRKITHPLSLEVATPESKSISLDAVIHMQESPPHKRLFLVPGRMQLSPFMRLASTSRRFALGGASDVYLVGENPTCSVPAL